MEEAGAASDWARAFAGWFQEAAPAFHLGRRCWSRVEERRQPGVGLREQSEGSRPLHHTPRDYVQGSLEEILHGGSEPGTAAPQLGI